MVVIGLGWHLAYVAASTAVLRVFAREPRRRFIVQGATDTVVISLSGIAVATSSALSVKLGWLPFISIYMGIHGALLLLALSMVAAAWRERRGAAAEAAAAARKA
ncbi:MAG: hypothetical protein J3K34DRAFT_475913 [Monoraphidium minutum]|nr:MAG: hypothetical protein J3K34DRAFT_475913 [Monoraphidium minutum]